MSIERCFGNVISYSPQPKSKKHIVHFLVKEVSYILCVLLRRKHLDIQFVGCNELPQQHLKETLTSSFDGHIH